MRPPGEDVADRRAFYILRGGMLLSGILVLAGLVLAFIHGSHSPDLRVYHGEPEGLTSVPGILVALVHGNARALMLTGVLALVLTPLARLVVAATSFVRARDWFYVVWSVLILGLVALGWMLGAAH
jgi:uncharacterized membrane protein